MKPPDALTQEQIRRIRRAVLKQLREIACTEGVDPLYVLTLAFSTSAMALMLDEPALEPDLIHLLRVACRSARQYDPPATLLA